MDDEGRRTGGGSRGGRALVVLVVALLAVAGFLGFRGELPGWPGRPDADSGVPVTLAALPPLDTAAVTSAVAPALVHVSASTEPFGMAAAGSGIVLTADGQVLTSHHVVKGADTVTVTDVGNGLVYDATVLGYDAGADIALLALTGASGLATARIGSSSEVRIRDEVVAIGNAGGAGGAPTAVLGTVTDLDSTIVALNAADLSRKSLTGMFEIAAPVSSGQSGGALADRYGAVIGVIAAASGEAARAVGRTPNGYAVPMDSAMRVVEQIRSGTPTETVHIGPTATLGAVISNAEPDGSGVKVRVVIYGMPAHQAGLTEGEVITALDDRIVTTVQSLQLALNLRKPQDTVRLAVTGADGARRTVSMVLTVGPPN